MARPGTPNISDYPEAVYDNFLAVDPEMVRRYIGRYLVTLHMCSIILKGRATGTVVCGTSNSCRLHERWYRLMNETAWADVENREG